MKVTACSSKTPHPKEFSQYTPKKHWDKVYFFSQTYFTPGAFGSW